MSVDKKADYQTYLVGDIRVIQSLKNGYSIKLPCGYMEGTCMISGKLLDSDCEVIELDDVYFIDLDIIHGYHIVVNKKQAEQVRKNFEIE